MDLLAVLKSALSKIWATQMAISEIEMLLSFLLACLLALYMLCIYRLLTRRGVPTPNFEKTLVCLPVIATTIVFALQINVLASLGALGALSIVRFRNAVKDPLDLIFLFWAVSVGMLCGTSIYIIAIFASAVITVALFALDMRPKGCHAYVLALRCAPTVQEAEMEAALAPYSTQRMVRSRNVTKNGVELLFELSTKQDAALVAAIAAVAGVEHVSLVAHDGELRY